MSDDTVGTPDQQSESGTTDSAIDHKHSPTVHELRDVDAYREFLSGWVLQAVPLDHDDFGVRWVTRDLPDVMLNRYTTAGALREVYVKEPGVTAFVLLLPAAGGDDFRVRGRRLDPMTLSLLQPGTEYEIISPAGGHTLEAYVPDELRGHKMTFLLDPPNEVPPSHASSTRRRCTPHGREWRVLSTRFAGLSARSSSEGSTTKFPCARKKESRRHSEML